MAYVEEGLCFVSSPRKDGADDRFKNEDGEFGKPEYTIPDADDGDGDQDGGDEIAA